MVDVAFVRREFATGVLADTTITIPDAARAEARTAERDFGVFHRDDHGRHTHRAARSVDGIVLFTNRKFQPVLPTHGHDAVIALDVESGRGSAGHHAEGLGGCLGVDCLPVAVEHQHGGFV